MKKRHIIRIFLLLSLCFNIGCEVSGGRASSSSISNISFSESNSTTKITSSGLPISSKEFIEAVNSIVVSVYSYEDIEYAFMLFDALEEWNYPEVLEAYDLLCEKEQEYNTLVAYYERKQLFLEKVEDIPEEFTLDDEYLIIRAEDSYSKLSDELKEDIDIIEAYNLLVSIRTAFNQMKEEAEAKKDASDAALFLESVATLSSLEELSYSDYFTIKEILENYELLSEKAKLIDGVSEAYSFLNEGIAYLNIKDGTGLFDINVLHRGTKWEAMLDIQGKDEENYLTGSNQIHDLKVYKDGVQLEKAAIKKWGDAPAANSYTRDNGIHSFSFTINTGYSDAAIYTMTFFAQTDNNETYAVSFYYMVDAVFTCDGYTYKELFQSYLQTKVSMLFETDYTPEDWQEIQNLLTSGIASLETADSKDYARMLCNQYYLAMLQIDNNLTSIETLSIADYSSIRLSDDGSENKSSYDVQYVIDNKTGTRWQANTNKNEYIVLDLSSVYSLVGIDIMWQNANAESYTIKVSNENSNWDDITEIYTFENGLDGNRTDQIRFNEEARYIRLDFIKCTNSYGFSIFEIDVYC